MSADDETLVYESPDRGKTVYAHRFGAPQERYRVEFKGGSVSLGQAARAFGRIETGETAGKPAVKA